MMPVKMTMFNKIYSPIALALLVFSSLLSCRVGNDANAAKEAAAPNLNPEPTLLLLHYCIKKTPMGSACEIRLVSQSNAAGKLKPDIRKAAEPIPGDLICLALNASNQPIQQIRIENPLRKTLEYVDADGQFAVKTIETDSAHFLLRFPYDPQIKTIALDQVNAPGKANIRLLRTKIDAL